MTDGRRPLPFEDKLSSLEVEPDEGIQRPLPFEVDEPATGTSSSLPFRDKLSTFVDEPRGRRTLPFEELDIPGYKLRLPFENSNEFARPPAPLFARGDMVERLLDDVSDIWSGAVILIAHPGDLYDVEYVDDHTVERNIEAVELRARTQELNMPAEVWEQTGCYLQDREDLCAFECLARAAQVAAKRSADGWWRAAYHSKFGRCGGACDFKGESSEGSAPGKRMSPKLKCVVPASGPRSWKERFRARDHRSAPWEGEEAAWDNRAFTTTGQVLHYTQIDGRLRYGQTSSNDRYFDPRLGCMVSDGL